MNGNPVSSHNISDSSLKEILEAEQFNANNAIVEFDKLDEIIYVNKIRELYSIVNKGTDPTHLIRSKLMRLSEINFLYSIFNIFKMHFNISMFCLRNSIETALFTFKYVESGIKTQELDDIYIRKDETPEEFDKLFRRNKFPKNDSRITPLKNAWEFVNDWGCHINFQSVAPQVKMKDESIEVTYFDENLKYIDNLRQITNYLINSHFHIINIHYLSLQKIIAKEDSEKLFEYFNEYESYKNTIRHLFPGF